MSPVRPRIDPSPRASGSWAAFGFVLLLLLLPLGLLAGSAVSRPGAPWAPSAPSAPLGPLGRATTTAVSIDTAGPVPTETAAGVPADFSWEALDAQGARVSAFAVAAELTVTESANGSAAPAWVNASAVGPLVRSPNGTFAIPAAAWSGGWLNLTADLAAAVPVSVRLFGPLLPSLPEPVVLTVLPDLDHLVLYDATGVENALLNSSRSYSAFWHVRDRFGNPAPGASLLLEFSSSSSVTLTVVPVMWSTGGTSGAWVNFTAPGGNGGTVTVRDEAGTTLLGPFTVPAVAAPASSAASLSWLALAVVALLGVGGVGGVGALLVGGRPRAPPAPTAEEEELRRLAEGRLTVVELVRRSGPLTLHEIEAAWEPPPAPPAVADWVASLVTDGTLTASLGEGGRARFSLAERPVGEPRVTLDADALEEGIARRDAALAKDDRPGEEAP